MRFLTYNLWHGLSPSSLVAFEALEPVARRKMREDLQLQVLKELKPDICFFQEVNPAQKRAPQMAQELGMQYAIQPDLVGLKMLGMGFPFNLNSGLVVMGADAWGLKKVTGVSLSRPGTHYVQSWASWQLKEERFALFCETLLPKWGRVLLINTHLHHGLESTPEVLQKLDKVSEELNLSESLVTELRSRMAKGNGRRAQEVAVLLRTLEKIQNRYEVVVLAGDFNASPESELGSMLRDLGFQDTWVEANADQAGYTFDRTANSANHILQDRFPLTFMVEDLSFSSKVKDALLEVARQQEFRARRIDYIWVRASSAKMHVKKAEMVGYPNAEGLAPSDHFGLCVDMEVV